MALIPVVSKFHFYQQVRLLLRKLRDGVTSDAELLDKKLSITSSLSLDAPDGEVESLSQVSPEAPLQVTAWQNGLTGAMGALPAAYTEWLIERQYRYSDRSAKAFLDIFGHRLYCLDFLAWQKHHLYAQAESGNPLPMQDTLLALSGLLMSGASPELRQHASLFASPVRSMVNLESWLTRIFDVSVQVIPFTGGWRDCAESERCKLGCSERTLASAPMIGRARQDIPAHFDVVLGPISPECSRRFTDSGSSWRDLWVRIREYVGPVIDFSVSLTISTADLPPQPLGASVLGVDMCLGRDDESFLHQVRLSAPDVE